MNKSPLIVSDANTWANCTGSVGLSAGCQYEDINGTSEARREGRAFHEVSQRILESFKGVNRELVSKPHVVNTTSNDGVLITDEIYDSALEYTNDVLRYCNSTGTMRDLHIEERIELGSIYPELYGYCDAWVFHPETLTLVVWEGKYGHRFVDALENYQLIAYVAGILDLLKIDGYMDQQITVKMRVVQPRCYQSGNDPIEWECKASELRQYINTLIMRAYEALNDGVCKTGEWCKVCPGRYRCETLQRANYQGIDYERSANSHHLDANDLGVELRILKRAEVLLKARLSGLEAQAQAELEQGNNVNGFMMEPTKGRKRWLKSIDQEEVILMGDMMGFDLRKPRELTTPAKCLQLGLDDSVINAYSETPMTGTKLTELNNAKIRNMFRIK